MSVQETPLGRLHNSRYSAVRKMIVYAPDYANAEYQPGRVHSESGLNPPNKYVSSHRATRYALSNGILYILLGSPGSVVVVSLQWTF